MMAQYGSKIEFLQDLGTDCPQTLHNYQSIIAPDASPKIKKNAKKRLKIPSNSRIDNKNLLKI